MADENPPDFEARPTTGAGGEIFRLVIVSTVVVLIFAGGIYWLRHLPAGLPAQDAGVTTIQVRLMETPDPAPFPLTASETTEPALSDNTAHQPPTDPVETTAVEEEATIPSPPVVAQVKRPPGTAVALNQSSSRQVSPDLALKFQRALQRHIAQFQHYPASAKDRGVGGTAKVLFVLRRDGSILDAWVEETSGQPILDIEAVETVRRAEPLPTIPQELPDQLRILIPVAFAP